MSGVVAERLSDALRRGDLPAVRALLERSAGPGDLDGSSLLALGVAAKLVGGKAGVARARDLLERAVAALPRADAARQRALFVLGLTHGDAGAFEAAVACFEEAARLDEGGAVARAAAGYARAYREAHGLDSR